MYSVRQDLKEGCKGSLHSNNAEQAGVLLRICSAGGLVKLPFLAHESAVGHHCVYFEWTHSVQTSGVGSQVWRALG